MGYDFMTSRTPSWRAVLLILGCALVLLVAVYWSTANSFAEQWFTSTYAHAVLVPPVGLYLGWRRRRQLALLVPNSSFWMLILTGMLSFVWLLGELTSTAVVQQFSLVAMMMSLVCGGVGTPAVRVLAGPLLFLFLAVPMGDSLIPLLQDFSAWFAVKLLDATRVPALLEGRMITIPSGRWDVAAACSGIRYLLASLTIGFVYADITYRKWGRRVAFLVASAVVPVLANGMRVYGIIMTDYLGGARMARSADHILAGWVFLSMVTVSLFALGSRWREGTLRGPSEDASDECELTGGASNTGKATASVSRLVLFAFLGLAVAGAGALAAKILGQHSQAVSSVNLRAFVASPPWRPTGRDLLDWRPMILGPDAELEQVYQGQGRFVKLYVAYYEPRGKDAKVVSSSNSLFDPNRWRRIGETSAKTTIEGKTVRVHQTSVRSAESYLILWHWYWVDGTFTSNDFEAKWLLAKSRLTRSPLGSAVIIVAVDEQPGDSSAPEILGNFVSQLLWSHTLQSPLPNNAGRPTR